MSYGLGVITFIAGLTLGQPVSFAIVSAVLLVICLETIF